MDSFEGNFSSELYVDSEFFPRVTERLYEMHRSRTLCDVNLSLSNSVHSYPVHRCVLAANSQAFYALLGEVPTPEVTLTVGDAVVVESLIEYMYLGRLRVSLSSARDLLRLGMNYTIGNVVCLVEQHLSRSLSLSTWVEIFRIAGEFQMTSIEQQTAEFLAANVDKILEGDEVEQLDYDLLRRILTGTQSADGWNWKVQFILRWCEGAHSERVGRIAELLDLVNFKDLDTFSLKLRLTDELMKKSHDAFSFAIQDCLSHVETSAVKLNSVNISTDKEFAIESIGKDLQRISETDENGAGQFTKLKEEKKPNNRRRSSEDGSKCFLKCYHRSSKRKKHRSPISEAKGSVESSNTELVNISSSQQEDDQGQKLSESSAKELSACETDMTENQITLKSGVLSGRDAMETEMLKPEPSRVSCRKQLLSSTNVNALSVTQCSNSTTVCGDGHKRSRRVRRKRAKTVDEMYGCPLCPKRFPTCSGQKRHTKGHGCETPLLCDVCGFSTIHPASMRIHNQSHFGKRLKCRYEGCTYSAIRSADLEDHHDAHNGIKSHVCSICGKAFSRRRHHIRHEKIHTNPKKFACSKCKYHSGRSDKMREHERKHHEPKRKTDRTNSMAAIEKKEGNSKRRKKTKANHRTEETVHGIVTCLP